MYHLATAYSFDFIYDIDDDDDDFEYFSFAITLCISHFSRGTLMFSRSEGCNRVIIIYMQ